LITIRPSRDNVALCEWRLEVGATAVSCLLSYQDLTRDRQTDDIQTTDDRNKAKGSYTVSLSVRA